MATGKKVREEKKQYVSAKTYSDKADAGGFVPKSINMPKGVTSLFKFKEAKTYRLLVLPFETKNNPDADPGMMYFVRKYYAHRNVGANQETFTCPQRTFGKRCPICEYAGRQRQLGKMSDDDLKGYWPKTRQLYYVVDLDDKEAGIQLFETAYNKSFGELLKDKIDEDVKGDYGTFYATDPADGGCIVKVTTKKDKFNGNVFYAPVLIEFVPRKNPLDPKVEAKLEKLPSLDDLVVMTPYDELNDIFLMKDVTGDEEGNGKPKNKKKTSDEDEEVEETEEEEEAADEEEEEAEETEGEDEEGTEDEDEDAGEGDDEEAEEETDEEEDDEGGVELKKGMLVSFEYRGKVKQGKVVKIDEKKNMVHVDTGGERPAVVDADEISLVEDDEEVEDEEIEEEAGDEDEGAEESDEDDGSDEEEEEAFDEEEIEEEEEGEKPRRGKKPAPKPAPKKKPKGRK